MALNNKDLKVLSDFERKLLMIVQHYNQSNKSPGIQLLGTKTGQSEENVTQTIQDLVARKWLVVCDKKLLVSKRLF